MSNDLITIPDYNPNKIRYIKTVELRVNGVPNVKLEKPLVFHTSDRKLKRWSSKYWSKFIFKTYIPNGNTITIRDDPLECLKKIMKEHPNLKYHKWITEKTENVEVPFSFKNDTKYDFEIKYLLIREELIPYLEHKLGQTKEVIELKKLFSAKNNMTFDDYINKKSKQLSEMDLSDFIEDLNKKTKKKTDDRSR